MQVSLVRSITTGREDTPFTRLEDEVFGLHPVLDIDSAALKRQPDQESLAFSCHIEKALSANTLPDSPLAYSSYIYFGRVAIACPAGFGSAVRAFMQGKELPGGLYFLCSVSIPPYDCKHTALWGFICVYLYCIELRLPL